MSKKESEECKKVLDYLRKQNRPYSAQDITCNLNKEVGKAAVQRALDLFVAEKKIREKVYNKQKVYCVEQSTMPRATGSEMKELDSEIANAEENVKKLKAEFKALEEEVKRRKNSLTLEELKAKAEESCDSVKELTAQLAEMESRGGEREPVTEEEKSRVQKQHATGVGHWRKRKRMAMNMLDQILEEYPKSKRELLEVVGIETDEDVGVKIPETK